MTRRGRPLRFLALVLGSWVGARILILWPQTGSLPEAIRQTLPVAVAGPAPAAMAVAAPPHRPKPTRAVPTLAAKPAVPHPPILAPVVSAADPYRVQMALLANTRYGASIAAGPPQGQPPLPPWLPDRLPPLPTGWSVSAWAVARPGTGIGAALLASQLGGSQAGARIAYMLVARHRLAAVARIAAPLKGRGAEASIGIEWQPTPLPVRLVAEHRFGIDGVASGYGAGVIAGTDAALPLAFRLESYGQAGVLRRTRTEPYADGALRLTRDVAAAGKLRLALGAGAWGAAQRDAARLDLGPSATLSWHGVRLALDWRQRVAGDARPGSGPALSLGTDF